MMVSVSFSGVIYSMLIREVNRFARAQRERIEAEQFFFAPAPPISEEVFEEARNRILENIIVANGLILVISGGIGYFLAGKTLAPIQGMVDEQNRFISDASHELRTPLTALRSSMEVYLRDKKQTLGEAKELISGGLDEVKQMQQLSDAMLRLTQYQDLSRRGKLQRFPINIAIEEAIKKVEPMAKIKNIKISQNCATKEMLGYKNEITELATILLDNAIKYSPEKSEIIVEAKKQDGVAELKVSDQGMGISAEDIPHLFDRFFRADSARTKNENGGYGLGLSIAKQIAERHHGTITVESEENKGSVFTAKFQEKKLN